MTGLAGVKHVLSLFEQQQKEKPRLASAVLLFPPTPRFTYLERRHATCYMLHGSAANYLPEERSVGGGHLLVRPPLSCRPRRYLDHGWFWPSMPGTQGGCSLSASPSGRGVCLEISRAMRQELTVRAPENGSPFLTHFFNLLFLDSFFFILLFTIMMKRKSRRRRLCHVTE